jgi:pyridoxal phosphate enzyme (YggS family)
VSGAGERSRRGGAAHSGGVSATGNLARVREQIDAAARRAGRDPSTVTLLGASKTVPAAVIAETLAAGLIDYGENRAQELVAKAIGLERLIEEGVTESEGTAQAPRWHFLGRLQRNKVAALAPRVTLWHSIDREELGVAIARRVPGARVLVEVNLGEEAQKGGCDPDAAGALVDALRALGLQVVGLMTVPPNDRDPRLFFAELRELGVRLEVPELSMGMSGDFEVAIEEGATVVRVGRAIFGARPPVV